MYYNYYNKLYIFMYRWFLFLHWNGKRKPLNFIINFIYYI